MHKYAQKKRLRRQVIRLAHAKPELRLHLLPMLRVAAVSDEAKKRVQKLLADAKGKEIPDEKIHALADELGISAHDLESYVYSLASEWAMRQLSDVNPGGRAEEKGVTEKDFDKATIDKGIEVELEHTKDREQAKRIVLDHLAESASYYDALAVMEKELETKSEESGKEAALRSDLIRLAHQKPELRSHLLPILAQRGRTAAFKVVKKIGPANIEEVTTSKGKVYYRVGWSNQAWGFDSQGEAEDFAKEHKRVFERFDEVARLNPFPR